MTATPNVVSVSSPTLAGTYKVGDTIQVSVGFDQAVTVTGTPQLTLETGTADCVINYETGSDSTVLTFSYTVQAGDWSLDLDALSSAALSLNGGTIRSTAEGVDATLALPTPGSAGSLSANAQLVIDGVAPTAAINASNTTLRANASATITFTFDEDPGASFTQGDLSVTGGSLGTLFGTGLVRTANFSPTAGINDGTATITLANGSYTDAAGNGGAAASITLSFDTLAPAAPSEPDLQSASDSGTSATDNITNNRMPTFSGTAEAGAEVRLYDTGGAMLGSTTADGSGNWAITSSFLVMGSHTISARVIDAAGNMSSASAALSVTIDSSASPNPRADLTPESDTGTSSTDNITSAGAVTLRQFSEAGATVSLYDNGILIGTTTSVNGGLLSGYRDIWSFTTTLAEGTHEITTQAVDLAGNSFPPSIELTILVDRTAPTTVVTSSALSADTGISDSDFITRTASQTISGTLSANLQAGESVQVSLDNGSTWSLANATVGTSSWSFDGTLASSGTLQVRVQDTAGNSGVSWSQAYALDTVADAPSVLALATGSDTGFSATDGLTRDRTPTVTGTAEAGATVTLYDTDGSTALGTATADAGGQWSVTSTLLADGAHQLTAQQTDAAGNTSVASGPLGITIEDIAPTVRFVASPQAAGVYAPGDHIVISVRFSEVVLVDGQPKLALETGSVDRTATFVGGSGTQMLTFRYTVQAGDSSADLDYLGRTALQLDGATIRDMAGNDAILTLPAPDGDPGSLAVREDIAIDGVGPALVAARVDGNVLVLRYDETLDGGNLPAASAFSVQAGGRELGIDSVRFREASNTLVLRLDESVLQGQAVTVEYRDDVRNQVRAIQDLGGNDAASLEDVAVRNLTIDPSTGAQVQMIGVGADATAPGAWS